jgi:hypothetical protein
MKPFTWQDRDSAAHSMLQLVYHGPTPVRYSALKTLQAIRSPSSIPELQQIALTTTWSNRDRSGAIYALAAMSNDIYLPEFASILARYVETGFAPLQRSLESTDDEVLSEQLLGEQTLLNAIFRFVGMHRSNLTWFLTLLAQAQASIKVEFLTWAISSNCSYPAEPLFLDILRNHLDLFPELMTLDVLNTLANHGDTPETEWLVAHVETFISLCVGADENSISSVLGYSPELTAKVAESQLEIAKLSDLFPYLETILEAKTSDGSSKGEPVSTYEPTFYSSVIWRRLEQIYDGANSGNEIAFEQLYELTDDSRLSVPTRAVATYFLGELWTHKRALSKLCRLACESDDSWGPYDQYQPIRIQALDALHTTGTPQAWEALVNVIFLERGSLSSYPETYLRWLSSLTSQLDPSIPFEPVEIDKYNSHIESHPWFHALTETNDDIDMILNDLEQSKGVL